MKKYFVYAAALVVAACGSNHQETQMEEQPQGPLAKSVNTDTFNLSFGTMLSRYYALKDNFIAEKISEIDASAKSLQNAADSLLLSELKADTGVIATAQTYAKAISAELIGLVGEKGLDAKRKSFQMVSDQLYDLVRTVRYDRTVIYHQYCPMAFNDQGANWLSSSSGIRNPYLPKTMLSCGEVKDSLDFRQKQ